MGQASDAMGNMLSGNYDPTRRNPYEGQTATVGTNKYAGANPYLGQMIDQASGDITRNFNNSAVPGMMAQFQSGGAFGGSAMQNVMADSQRELAGRLGNVSTQLRSQDYDRQVGLAENDINRRLQSRQTDLARNAGLAENRVGRHFDSYWQNQANDLSAAGMASEINGARYDDARALMNIGQQQQNLAQGAYDTAYGDFQEWRDWDANRLGVLSNALGAIQGGTATQTGPNPNYRSAGQNAAGYAALLASMWG